MLSYLFSYIHQPLFSFHNIALLNPQGIIASKELDLMVDVIQFMVVIVITVFAFMFLIVWKFRVTNKKEKIYSPEWDHNMKIELIWWAIPFAIVAILSVIVWKSSHDLDPFRPIDSQVKPLTIQVVALDWKWLFIYPEQGIATVNFVEFPAGTPINFQVTADAPMNSFWIPQLGGQIYAMPGMSTQLHLEASQSGSYNGLSANISGEGFSGMKFIAQSVTQENFDQWVASVQKTPDRLDQNTYAALVAPSQDDPISFYSSIDKSLYNDTVMKFMFPQSSATSSDSAPSVSLASPMGDMPGMNNTSTSTIGTTGN